MRILNLYAGLGGNRKLWPAEYEVTAVELDPEIAAIYQEHFPQDQVIVGDAHQYLLDHFKEYNFIWSSPPCPSHSRIRFSFQAVKAGKVIYPDLQLYEEIIFLKHHYKGSWVVENVVPYYHPLVKPTAIRDRHMFWSNFPILSKALLNKAEEPIKSVTVEKERFGFSLTGKKVKNKRQLLRNLVDPKLGLFIFKCAFKDVQVTL